MVKLSPPLTAAGFVAMVMVDVSIGFGIEPLFNVANFCLWIKGPEIK